MTRNRDTTTAVLLAALVVVSVFGGSVAFTGTASAAANNLSIVSEQPASGTGTVTVAVTTSSTGSTVALKVRGADGTVSNMTTVTDGSREDSSPTKRKIVTTLDLGTLFDTKPASGTALIGAKEGGGDFSFRSQTYDKKRQFTIDAAKPTALVTGASASQPEPVTAQAGDQVKVIFTATDTPQKVQSVTMDVTGPDGAHKSITDLQGGKDRSAQFVVPTDWSAGEYDVTLTVTDEAGHEATDMHQGGLVIESAGGGSSDGTTSGSATANNVGIVSAQPVNGTGALTVRAGVSTPGANVSFKVKGAGGTVSGTETVTDGGLTDKASSDGVVRTTLDLGSLFETTPESGTAVVYAAGGDSFNIAQQTYDAKRQVTLDADAPTVAVATDTSTQFAGYPGDQIQVTYSAGDVPQKVQSLTLTVAGPNGTVHEAATGLQVGNGRTAQFVVGSGWSAGEYDLVLTAVDEVGHQTTARYEDGLLVRGGTPSVEVNNLKTLGTPPIKGTGTAVVETTVSTPGAKASFKVQGANGTISATKTVTDGGPADQSPIAGLVETGLDLGDLFGAKPASGTAVIYAAGGVDEFSIEKQTFDIKQQVAVDADAPTVVVTGGSTNKPMPAYTQSGTTTQVYYRATDVPQKIKGGTMRIVGPGGTVRKTIAGLQSGNGQSGQFFVPRDWEEGQYTATFTAVDEVGHQASDTYEGALVVDNTQPAITSAEIRTVGVGDEATRKIFLDVREQTALNPETVSAQDFDISGHSEQNVNVTLSGDITITPGRLGNNENVSDTTPILNDSESPSVVLNGSMFIADMANNRLSGRRIIAESVSDGGPPQNPDEIYVAPDPIRSDDLSSVTVGVNFTRTTENESLGPAPSPPQSGTVHVRFQGPNETTVTRTMPANTSRALTEGTFNLTGSGLSDGQIEVRAKLVTDDGKTNSHGWDAPTYVTLETNSTTA